METLHQSPLPPAGTEEYISLAAAAALIRIDGKPARPSTAFRWYQTGIGGRHGQPRIHLKALRLGGRLVTKPSWVQDFLDAVAAAASAAPPAMKAVSSTIHSRSHPRRERDKQDAERRASAAGF